MLGRAAADALRSGPGRPARGEVDPRQGRGWIVRRRQCVPAGASAPVTAGILRRAEAREAAPAPSRAGRREPPPPLSRSGRRKPWPFLLAVLGGLLLLLAFPGFDLPTLAPLGVAALALAVRGRRARAGFWLGLVFGLAFFVPLLSWSGVYVGPFPWLALALWEALHLGLLGAATALTSRLRLWPLWTAALWVADEALRGRFVLGGFPWGRLGLSQTGGPLTSLAAYGGVPLVSFAVALTGTLLAAAVLALGRRGSSVPDEERSPAVRGAAFAVAGALAVP